MSSILRMELCAIVLTISLAAQSTHEDAAAQTSEQPEVWTAIIFDAFAGNAYTWKLKRDGTYEEDGRDIHSGASIQTTLTGRWTAADATLTLRQDFETYVFDGVVRGDRYSGTFYSGKTALSKFCAWRGAKIPTGCNDDLVG